MTSVEAAASLFGAEDVSSDPFADLGTAQTTGADHLVDGISPVPDTVHITDAHTVVDSSAMYTESTEPAPANIGQFGWGGGQASDVIPEETTYLTTTPHHHTSVSDAAHDSYAPLASASVQHTLPDTSANQQQYSPYGTASQSSSYHPPPQPSYTPYTYNPPSTEPTPSQYTGYSSLPPPPPSVRSTVAVPPPPPSSVPTVNRPRVANAYDPPFPTSVRSSKRGTRAISGVQTYHSPAPPQSTVLPIQASLHHPQVLPPPSLLPSQHSAPPPQQNPYHSNELKSAIHIDNPYPTSGGNGTYDCASALAGATAFSSSSFHPALESTGSHERHPPVHTASQSHPGQSPPSSNNLSAWFTTPVTTFSQEGYSSPQNYMMYLPGQTAGQSLTSTSRSSSPAQERVHTNGKRKSLPQSASQFETDRGLDALAAPVLNKSSAAVFDPYAPGAQHHGDKIERTTLPGSPSARELTGLIDNSLQGHSNSRLERNRSLSNSSLLSSVGQDGPHASPYPTGRIVQESDHTSRYGVAHHETHWTSSQDVAQHSFNTSYAPSPSLIGANDPLGRSGARAPVISFGFSGKIITCFHGANTLSTGFDVALSSRHSTGIRIRTLNNVIPESAVDPSLTSFPGPLFSEPGAQATSLVRTGPTSQTKAKKAKVIVYLSQRTDELGLGLRYLPPDSLESARAEGKIILMKLLRLMVEHDGRLTGTPELDVAVRTILVPRLEGALATDNALSTSGFTTPADSSPYFSTPTDRANEDILSTTILRTSHLERIQDFLLRGQRKRAYHYALDEKLWAHAMIVASSIDKEAWKEVVNEFLKSELAVPELVPPSHTNSSRPPVCGAGLRVAYSLFSGQGAAAAQELLPQNLLSKAVRQQPLQPHLSHLIAPTPNFPSGGAPTSLPAPLPSEVLKHWPETMAMMLSYPLSQETSAALTSLGDQLAASHLIEAAHVCYLLSPQTSPIGGLGHSSARIVLVGSRSPWPTFAKDVDPMIFSEIVEFALSLTPPSKGQEQFNGIPHLQPYRFIRAMWLAEFGDIQQANKYCEAIFSALSRNPSYVTTTMLEQLQGLSDRIGGVIQPDKSFWAGTKIRKPGLETIGGWLEGRFTKLVTGDDSDKPENVSSKVDGREFSGPFSHYSAISSATSSARSSPQPSAVNYHISLPARTGSAMSYSAPYSASQVDRASSAMDYVKKSFSPPPPHRVISANSSVTTFTASSFGPGLNGRPESRYSQTSDDLVTPRPSLTPEPQIHSNEDVGWWSSSAHDENNSGPTPTAATFVRIDSNMMTESSDGFISLMDNIPHSVGPTAAMHPSGNGFGIAHIDDEVEEDLGFGNSKSKPKSIDDADPEPSPGNRQAQSAPSPPPEKAPTPATNTGWFSRWWKKSDGPVKANLGEESDFYFDKDLGRWVNKKADAEPSKPAAPPPPPSRVQTASPGMTGPRPGIPEPTTPPPARSASAIDLSTSPPSRTTMRVRSNLVPTESAPSTPTGSRLTSEAPPPGRPRSSQASKRNIRSRYVNVLQEGNSL